MTKTPECPSIARGQKLTSQDIEKVNVLEAKKRPPNPSRFRFEQVNEVTWKLTNGEITETPASHGQWGSYRTTKALAWVICVAPRKWCVGPRKWLARYGDMVSGPLSLPKAKAAAMAMAMGRPGDYHVQNPISHLNGLTARLIDLRLIDVDEDPLTDVGGGNE
jgi:hypothetical protein